MARMFSARLTWTIVAQRAGCIGDASSFAKNSTASTRRPNSYRGRARFRISITILSSDSEVSSSTFSTSMRSHRWSTSRSLPHPSPSGLPAPAYRGRAVPEAPSGRRARDQPCSSDPPFLFRVSIETRGPSTLFTSRVTPAISTVSPGSGGRPKEPRMYPPMVSKSSVGRSMRK